VTTAYESRGACPNDCAAGSGCSERTCAACQEGFFSGLSDSHPCGACPEGYTTSSTGATSAEQCNVVENCYLFIDMTTTNANDCLNLAEVQAKDSASQVIAATGATLSSTMQPAVSCIDGNFNNYCQSTCAADDWLRIDYSNSGNSFVENLNTVKVFNRISQAAKIVGATLYAGCSTTPPTTHAEASSGALLSTTFDSGQNDYIFASDLVCSANCAAGSGCNIASQQCEVCPAGSYSAYTDPYTCLSCPHDTTTAATGSTSATACVMSCESGTYSSTRTPLQDGVKKQRYTGDVSNQPDSDVLNWLSAGRENGAASPGVMR